MTLLTSLLSVLAALTAAAYLQLPTFMLVLGYRWFHNYRVKRWIFRTLAIVAFAAFMYRDPPAWAVVSTAVPVVFFLIFSLFNANPKVYIALNEETVRKEKDNEYPLDTEVLGYADEAGNAIVYPLEQLVRPRHILNDVFSGNPLLVSYCMACRSAMVYHPLVDGKRLQFEVLGVYRRNMVMGDVETGTVWQQGTGEAMFGNLKGKQLQCLPYQIQSMKDWLTVYPNSFIAYESEKVKDGLFSKERLMKMMKVTETFVAPGRTDLQGLPLRETVFGVQLGDGAKAYPVSELRKAEGVFTDYIGNSRVSVEYDALTRHIRVTDAATGNPLAAQSHWWFGWKEFHPASEIWRHDANTSSPPA